MMTPIDEVLKHNITSMPRADDDGMHSSRTSFNFTEAVPLSLSSLAHMSVPLDEGIWDGICALVKHMQVACVNYARATSPNQYTLRELWVDDWQWTTSAATNVPPSLLKLGMKHKYCQRIKFCLGQPLSIGDGNENGNADGNEDLESWLDDPVVHGVLCFWYVSEDLFTEEELMDDDDMKNEDDDIPTCILYKVTVEYRSLPPTANKMAVEAEELSMLSFGASVDDAVKYGALASLYDENAKYVMEICSVRGKKYKFDLMDSTLSDGRLPRWRAKEGTEAPFVKSLCVTVTDHNFEDNISRLSLILDGILRKPKECQPKLHHYTKKLPDTFLVFRKPVSVMAIPSRQALLLDPDLAGKVFVDGRYITTWGHDSKIGSHAPALFGLDLNSIPVWHGRIVDYDLMKKAYTLLWQEILVDSRLKGLDLANKLLCRLMYGMDETELYDDEDDKVDTSGDTLESQLMSCAKYDPIGICAKALAFRFALEFGMEAIPVEAHEVLAAKKLLSHRIPIVVPARLISILRLGGYYDVVKTTIETWFAGNVRPPNGDFETKLIDDTMILLSDAGADDISANQVVFVTIDDSNPEKHFNLCRYNTETEQYHVNECMATATPVWLALCIAREHPEGGIVERNLLKKSLMEQE